MKRVNISWMPIAGFYVGGGGDTYGDVVIWIGRFFCSWDWGGNDD